MKKLLLVAMMAISTMASKAQQQETGTWSITPKAEFGYVSMNDFDKIDGGLAASVNGDAKYQLNEKFGVSAGLGFFYMQSDKYNSFYDVFEYITLPVLAHFDITKNLSLQAGLKFGFLMTAKSEYDGSGMAAVGSFKDDCEGMNLYVPVGLSWTFNKPFVLGLQCNIPVTKMNKKGDSSAKLTWFMTSFGYRFDL